MFIVQASILGMSHSTKWTCYPLRFLAGDAVRRARALKMCSITRRRATSVLLPPGCSSPSCSSSGTFGESTSYFSRSTPGYKLPGYIGKPGCGRWYQAAAFKATVAAHQAPAHQATPERHKSVSTIALCADWVVLNAFWLKSDADSSKFPYFFLILKS